MPPGLHTISDRRTGPECGKFNQIFKSFNKANHLCIFKFRVVKDFFSSSELSFLRRKPENKNGTGALSHQKIYAFMACTLYLEGTVGKPIFS